MQKLESLNIGDFFEMYLEFINSVETCVYVGTKIVPQVTELLGYELGQKLHCFIVDHGNYTHSYVAYGDEMVTKTNKSFPKSKFVVSEACQPYDNHRYFTYKDGIYTRHHTKKLMQKHTIRNYGVRQVEFEGNMPDDIKVEWMHLEKI